MRSLLRALLFGVLLLAFACGSAERGPTVRIGDDVELSLARACVEAGREQVLRIRAPYRAVAVFGAIYADGGGGGPEPFGAGYGGNGSEFLPESGVVETRWNISSKAPPGPVTVEVQLLLGSEGEEAKKSLTFDLVGRDERCP